ncbi:MAG TPA: DUF503 domain-containing protein [Syntrophomonas sp.]|nr:DUF503 domain-containing protein [Syntrophomonas sp.]
MFVLYGNAELFLPYCASLKEKRGYIQSITARIRKRFNVSIIEAAYHDLWQRSILGFAAVCSSNAEAEHILKAILETIEQHEDNCELIDFNNEIIKQPLSVK